MFGSLNPSMKKAIRQTSPLLAQSKTERQSKAIFYKLLRLFKDENGKKLCLSEIDSPKPSQNYNSGFWRKESRSRLVFSAINIKQATLIRFDVIVYRRCITSKSTNNETIYASLFVLGKWKQWGTSWTAVGFRNVVARWQFPHSIQLRLEISNPDRSLLGDGIVVFSLQDSIFSLEGSDLLFCFG